MVAHEYMLTAKNYAMVRKARMGNKKITKSGLNIKGLCILALANGNVNLTLVVMADTVENSGLSPMERRFLDYMQKGDDFMKIEIYRSAKECYARAEELNLNHAVAKSKLDNCNRLLHVEKKRIIIIVSVIAIVAVALLVFL